MTIIRFDSSISKTANLSYMYTISILTYKHFRDKFKKYMYVLIQIIYHLIIVKLRVIVIQIHNMILEGMYFGNVGYLMIDNNFMMYVLRHMV